MAYDPTPRRFRFPAEGSKRPTHGVYFPATDLTMTDRGFQRTGIPYWRGVEWIDLVADLPWYEPANEARDG